MMTAGEREKYLLAARLPSYKRKLEASLNIISEALKIHGEWMISFSGGKDSTVLADLLCRCGFKGKGIYFYYSKYENPEENTRQVEWARKQYDYDIKTVKCYGSYDAWSEVGHFFNIPQTAEEKAAAKKCKAGFKKASDQFMTENQCSNIFMGLCKEESRARKINLSIKGSTYTVKERYGYSCCPLANWTGADIWAYIASNELPYLSIYDLPYWSRERIRNELTVIYCPDLALKGELLQYRLAYPELFSSLKNKFSEVNLYA